MFSALSALFSANGFMPHGHCYLWTPSLVWTMVVTDSLIGAAYTVISFKLYSLVKRSKIPFSAMFIAFGIFILACGATHWMEIVTLWNPVYWLAALVKGVTAIASVATAVWIFPVSHKVTEIAKQTKVSEDRRVKLIDQAQALFKVNEELRKSRDELRRTYESLEQRVQERTAQLAEKNEILLKTEEKLKEAIRSRDEFLSVASHELKTPITSLSLQIQMTKKNINPDDNVAPPPAKLARVFEISDKQVTRLTNLVEDLLDVSRIQTGRLNFNFETVNLSELVKDMVARFSAQFVKARCPVQLDVQDEVIGIFDHVRIEQVIDNLLSNAAKYASGSEVKIHLTSTPSTAVIRVKDRGPGIAKDYQARIFERFERASPPKNISGLGLGLFIVKEIVRGHGGSVTVESEPGQGADFIISLPLKGVITNAGEFQDARSFT